MLLLGLSTAHWPNGGKVEVYFVGEILGVAIILIAPHTYDFAYEISNFAHRFLIGFSKKVLESSLEQK